MSKSQQSRSRKAPSPLRLAIASAVAVVLLGSSFSAVRGGTIAGYNDEGSNGVDGAAIAAGVVGGGAAIYFIAGAIDKKKDEKKEGTSSSSADSTKKVESVRVMPQSVRLARGAAQDFQVQVRYAGETAWQNVTNSPNASLRLSDSTGGVTAMDGAKNVFTAPIDGNGPATAKVIGSFGGVQAASTVSVQ